MSENKLSADEVGLVAVLVERLERQRLPRALDLEAKVKGGEVLDELDIAFLDEVLEDAGKLRPWLDRHPEYQPLAARVLELYRDIVALAVQNEQQQPK